jgi:hypothetical protein
MDDDDDDGQLPAAAATYDDGCGLDSSIINIPSYYLPQSIMTYRRCWKDERVIAIVIIGDRDEDERTDGWRKNVRRRRTKRSPRTPPSTDRRIIVRHVPRGWNGIDPPPACHVEMNATWNTSC